MAIVSNAKIKSMDMQFAPTKMLPKTVGGSSPEKKISKPIVNEEPGEEDEDDQTSVSLPSSPSLKLKSHPSEPLAKVEE